MSESGKYSVPFTQSEAFILITRLVQVIGMPLAVAIGGWVLHTLASLDHSVTTLQAQMEDRTSDRYTATDAKHDFAVIGVEINDLDRRVGVLETTTPRYQRH